MKRNRKKDRRVGKREIEIKEWSGTTARGQTWTVKQADAFAALRTIEEGSVDCVITSPPYFWLRDYRISGQIGLEDKVAGYVSAINRVMSEVFKVLRREGVLFLNLGDTYYSGKGESQGEDLKSSRRRFGLRAVDKSGGLGIGLQRKSAIGIPWRVAERMCRRGWILRSSIIWHRQKFLHEAVKDRPRRSYEYVFMFAKSRRYFFERKPLIEQKVDEDVWTIAAPRRRAKAIDTAPFPDALVERCLSVGCPEKGMVLDPFAGSGTTLRVALRTGRSAIGVDLHPEFCAYMVEEMRGLESEIL